MADVDGETSGASQSVAPPADQRVARQRDQRRLLAAVLGFLIIVGTTVIGVVYGLGPAALGLVCLLAGASVLLLLWGILRLIERIGR